MLPGYDINRFDAILSCISSRLHAAHPARSSRLLVMVLQVFGSKATNSSGAALTFIRFKHLSTVFCAGLHHLWACALQASSPTLARALLCSCPPLTTLPRRRSSQALSSG